MQLSRLGSTAPSNVLQFGASSKSEPATCLFRLGAKLLGKGHDYYCAAINIEPSPSLFFKLGNVLSAIGDKTKSTDMFKEGLEFSISER